MIKESLIDFRKEKVDLHRLISCAESQQLYMLICSNQVHTDIFTSLDNRGRSRYHQKFSPTSTGA